MKKRLLFILGLLSVLILTSCISSTKTITKISEEVEYTKIESSITKVYDKVSKGCVGISVSNDSTAGTGSGVIYKYDEEKKLYYVVTNAHVVKDMTKCTVYFGDSKYNSSSILGYDSKNDVAVVTFTLDMFNNGLKDSIYVNDFFNYKDNDLVVVGQTALAIGCPLGLSNFNILTTGVVSSVSNSEISIDAAINPGNSGGGIFNLDGRMIGLVEEKNVWKFSSSHTSTTITSADTPIEGRGFCISMNVVKAAIKDIEASKGIVVRPVLGITVSTVNTILSPNSQYKDYFPVTDDVVYFIVTEFAADSSAKRCGIQLFDVLLEINGKKINQASDVSDCLNVITMNDSVKLKIYRVVSGKGTTEEIIVSFK